MKENLGNMEIAFGGTHMTNLIDNNGNKIFSIIHPNPKKDTIILLHGGPGFPCDFLETADVLRDSFQMITFQQRGTKNSPCKSDDYSMKAYISDIDSVAKFYGVTKFHLFGHSWGWTLRSDLCRKTCG